MITITLPLPPRELHPNSRPHPKRKWALTKQYRTRALGEALAIRPWEPWGSATTQATFYFATNRNRDRDNLLAWLKAAFDGIADADVIADESGFTQKPVHIEIDRG